MQRTTDTSKSSEPSLSEKLQERLARYAGAGPGQDAVSLQTLEDVHNLVVWLCQQSERVSATVSNDGLLSITTAFPNEVRLHVEVERDGSAGATVSRSRKHAEDLPVTTIRELTPELVLGAVGSP